ncbi:MAG: PDZ domain-containing protein [Alphaproteobacteria bacterium]|nr:PDZ domain-containing protein [Alphaproteobacteria bacterium]
MSRARITRSTSFVCAAAAAAVLVVSCAISGVAFAQGMPPQLQQFFGNLLGTAIQQAQIAAAARRSWEQVDQQVQMCLITTYNLSPKQLAQNGIRADDPRIVPYIQSCQQIVYAANQQAAHDEAAEAEQQERAQQPPDQNKEARAWLGVTVADLTSEVAREHRLATTRGAVVTYVYPGSPADRARINQGDVIIKFGDNAVTDAESLIILLNLMRGDEQVDMIEARGITAVMTTVRLAWANGTMDSVSAQRVAPEEPVATNPPLQVVEPSDNVQPAEPPPVAHSWYVVRATKSEAGGDGVDALQAAARQKIEALCAGDYSLTEYHTYDGTGEDASVSGVHEPWLDATVACAAERPVAPEAATAALTIDDLIQAPRNDSAKPIPGAEFFDVFTEELDNPYGATLKAVTAVLKNQDDRIAVTDKDKGMVVTAYPPKWDTARVEQFFIVLDPESDTRTRMTFKLVSRWRHLASSDKAEYHVDDRDTVSRRAAEFIAAVRQSLKR